MFVVITNNITWSFFFFFSGFASIPIAFPVNDSYSSVNDSAVNSLIIVKKSTQMKTCMAVYRLKIQKQFLRTIYPSAVDFDEDGSTSLVPNLAAITSFSLYITEPVLSVFSSDTRSSS